MASGRSRRRSVDPNYKKEQEEFKQEIQSPEAPFADLDPQLQMWKIAQLRIKGFGISQIAEKLGVTESTIESAWSKLTERMLAETDEMRKGLMATNILRLEGMIAVLMEKFYERFDRDEASVLMQAIKLEVQITKEQAPVVLNQQNNLMVHVPTLNHTSPLYQKTLTEMNPDQIRHDYPEMYARHERILTDPRVQSLGKLLEDTIDDAETTEGR